jgi:hypothetical protein
LQHSLVQERRICVGRLAAFAVHDLVPQATVSAPTSARCARAPHRPIRRSTPGTRVSRRRMRRGRQAPRNCSPAPRERHFTVLAA